MKKTTGIILVIIMLISTMTVFPAVAALTPISGAVLNDQLSFQLNGKAVVPVGDDGTPVLPISYNGTTYLPVRAVGYLLGLGIDWSAATNTVLITSTSSKAAPKATALSKSNQLIPISSVVLNSDLKFKLDGKAVVPVGDDGTPVLPISYNGTTYLPLRAMGYLLGLGIDWNSTNKTVLISSAPGNTSAPGWYLTHWEYYKHPYDTAETGGKVGRFANGDTYTDYTEGKGEKNNFINVTARRLSDGKIAASGHAVTLWADPPAYFSGSDRPSITIDRTVESNWGIGAFNIHFDNDTINPGGGTSSYLSFVTPDGKNTVQTYQGTLQMEKALKGSAGSKKAIILYLNGHGFKYYYEWRE